jgi:hypothetical protein
MLVSRLHSLHLLSKVYENLNPSTSTIRTRDWAGGGDGKALICSHPHLPKTLETSKPAASLEGSTHVHLIPISCSSTLHPLSSMRDYYRPLPSKEMLMAATPVSFRHTHPRLSTSYPGSQIIPISLTLGTSVENKPYEFHPGSERRDPASDHCCEVIAVT